MFGNKISKEDRRRIWIYIAISFGFAYLLALVIWMNGGLFDSPEVAPGIPFYLLILSLYMLAPTLGNILTRVFTKEGWQNTYLRPNLKKGWKFWLLAWIGTPVLLIFGAVVYFLIFPQYFDGEFIQLQELIAERGGPAGSPESVLVRQTLQIALLAPILNAIPILGEEFGWRAYLQPKLMPLGARKAMVITGIIWGLWHAPVIAMGYNYGNFEQNNYWGAPWSGMAMMVLGCIWLAIFFGWVSMKAKSVWPAVIGHGSVNGLAAIPLLVTQGTPLMLMGPTALGLVGGFGFILAAIAIFAAEGKEPENITSLQVSEA